MIIVKAFEDGFICRGYKYLGIGEKNVTDRANCARNGFHGAENPLDCAAHYRGIKNTVYCLCEASGDIDEDSVDSKITCTELTILRVLTMEEFVALSLCYIIEHPQRPDSSVLCRDIGRASNGFCVVRGKAPRASGGIGDVLGFCVERPDSNEIEMVSLILVDGETIKPHVDYGPDGVEIKGD